MRTLIFALLLMPTVLHAQTPEEEVRDTIERLFDGMRAGDSTMVASVFLDGATMGRATEEGFRAGGTDGFVRAVGSPRDQVWNEQIWDVVIKVDGRLAMAWMEFAFFLGDTLRHCGVNAMMLYRGDDGWKITGLADTNRGLDCELPDHLR